MSTQTNKPWPRDPRCPPRDEYPVDDPKPTA